MRALLLAAAVLLAAVPQSQAADFALREQMMRPDAPRALRMPSQMPIARSEQRTYLLPAKPTETSPAITLPESEHSAGLPIYPAAFGAAPKPEQPVNLLHIGPVQTEIIDGHTRYRIDGVSVMGGSVSGSVSGRGAKLFLRWRNN